MTIIVPARKTAQNIIFQVFWKVCGGSQLLNYINQLAKQAAFQHTHLARTQRPPIVCMLVRKHAFGVLHPNAAT